MIISSEEDIERLLRGGSAEEDYESSDITYDCLLPNGAFINVVVPRWCSVEKFKSMLWDAAKKDSLSSGLPQPQDCLVHYINSLAKIEVVQDESCPISSVHAFLSVLHIRERSSSVTKESAVIQNLISGSCPLDIIRDDEIIDFRTECKKKCEEFTREQYYTPNRVQLLEYKYSTELINLESIKEDTCNEKLIFDFPDDNRTFRIEMYARETTEKLIEEALRRKAQNNPQERTNPHYYYLKVSGQDEYLLPERDGTPRPLFHYMYIYRNMLKNTRPSLVLVKKSDIEVAPKPKPRPKTVVNKPPPLAPRPAPYICLYQMSSKLRVKVVKATKITCDKDKPIIVFLRAAIYHGIESIKDIKDTEGVQVIEGEAKFGKVLDFDIEICNLPRMAKLCLTLYQKHKKYASGSIRSRKQGNSADNSQNDGDQIAWVNMSLFNYKRRLVVGERNLCMWAYSEDAGFGNSPVNHLGTVVSNPLKGSAITLQLDFGGYDGLDKPILYPDVEEIKKHAASDKSAMSEDETQYEIPYENKNGELNKYLSSLDPFHPIEEQERSKIWNMRQKIMEQNSCNYLPVLLSSFRWENSVNVAQMITMLQEWPTLTIDTALELLDCAYPDEYVRKFAVSCLQKSMSDAELNRYLLQLVQALKFELYLSCDLVFFLLERAIKNRKIGHNLFWLLKSEMHIPSVSVRFGLIIEAYCNSSVEHLPVLAKQVDLMSKLQDVNKMIKSYKPKASSDDPKAAMMKHLDEYKAYLSELTSPLNPSYRLSSIINEKCKYMESKMKPLWLEWRNADPSADNVKIIFKCGDDLRQDMLTLQMLHIMDSIWLSEGLDLRMTVYECLASGRDFGMLEVVQNAETIANIQMKLEKSAVNTESIYQWLFHENGQSEAAMPQVIENFTLSCAGYCVASYVLGIGDRHNDNIMIKRSGQILHIDFGHFLGNFKKKFGISRERTPFVLTNHFIHVIKQSKNPNAFDEFQSLCERAFLILRKKGNLLISLFMMMVASGLPELRTVDDIKYIQESLLLKKPEDDALTHFRKKFKESVKRSWTVSLNWWMHIMNKYRKS